MQRECLIVLDTWEVEMQTKTTANQELRATRQDGCIRVHAQKNHSNRALHSCTVLYLALALGAQAGVALAQDLAVLGQVVLQREHVNVANSVKIDLVALQLSAAATALQLAWARAIALHWHTW